MEQNTNEIAQKPDLKSKLGDIAGMIFFAVATVLAVMAATKHPTLLAWLAVVHNALLAVIFAMRRTAVKTDQVGLIFGLLAAALPMAVYPDVIPVWLLIPGLAGYALTLWSLLALGRSFGIGPADRGLVKHGPYKLVRHPMYLGELVYRAALVGASANILNAIILAVLILLQVARIRREEKIIANYDDYSQTTKWRLIPGLW